MHSASNCCPAPRRHRLDASGRCGHWLSPSAALSLFPPSSAANHNSGTLGVQQWCTLDDADAVRRAGLARVDPLLAPLPKWLNALGMPGMTAYFGLLEVGHPQAGQTVVVSGAAGAVGQTVGQIARIMGCRTVGIAGGEEKCRFVVEQLGFDACIDYKAGSVREGLKLHAPDGVDVYFDNVGGEILDTVLTRINRGARIVICGATLDTATTFFAPSSHRGSESSHRQSW